MYFLLSPAKSLNETDSLPLMLDQHYRQPALISSSCELMAVLKTKEPTDIMELMKVSANIAEVNVKRNHDWAWDTDTPFTTPSAKPAVYLFNGGVYGGLDVYSMDKKQVMYLNEHLGILSGLYGLLKPLDLMLPYRLEMGTKLANPKGDDLYQFWGDSITQHVIHTMSNDNNLINLASNEYFKAIKKPLLKKQGINIITPRFEDEKNGKFKVISFYAKKARGLMVKYACDNQIADSEQLKGFDLEGYYYCDEISDDTNWIFRRDEL